MTSSTPAPLPTPSSSKTPSAPASLTERRKAATRMEIARAAAGLFAARGLKATRAEDIAQAAGIAPRTFYRYFASKEEAVAPLYAAGAQRWAEAVREAPPELTPPEALEHAVRQTLTPGVGISSASWEWVRTLIRLASASPALGKVWAEVCHASEGALGEVLRERAARTAATGLDNVAEPTGSDGSAGSAGPDKSAGSAGSTGSTGPAGSADSSHLADTTHLAEPTPRQRFVAAVAGAAVRVAVESWSTTDSPPHGPGGPAELALRNLEAVRGMEWREPE
ncbi:MULTISPECIES: TetR/AcrR family transcriptional regulator [Streptomyces]|uniref:TetR/AcrR family transcriptional regulator n=1 Tax=Streptomyces galilaeus TaxID=33899 RepID=A0ABW9IJU8_STRGJ